MTEYLSTTPGLFPLPDWAKDDLSTLKGHQKHDLISGDEDESIESVYSEVRNELIALQETIGLDRVVEGQSRWDDMLAHPLAVHDSVETRGIVRYFDNNNFYREPVITDDLGFSGDIANELSATDIDTSTVQAVIPGPWTLFSLATDEHYGDPDSCLAAIGAFLREEIAAFPEHSTLVLLEPALVTDPPRGDQLTRTIESINAIAEESTADVAVHTYWGSYDDDVYTGILDAGIDAVGFDFVNAESSHYETIDEHGLPNGVVLGIVDGQNTLVEDPEDLRNRATAILDEVSASVETAYLSTNTEPFYLPTNKFEAKLEALSQAAELAEVTAI